MTQALADLIKIRANFSRSVNIERDAADWLSNQAHYILTPLARSIMRQVTDGILNPRLPRAWSITGPYGTGKSAFALALVQLLSSSGNRPSILNQMEHEDAELGNSFAAVRSKHRSLLPVLISGRREPLVIALHRALVNTLTAAPGIRTKQRGLLLARVLETDATDTKAVCALYQEAARVHGGLIVVVDELGKFLEYVAQRPDQADVFILQELAEATARSGESPLLLFTILHQSYSRYAAHLTQSQREEFGKVQGRFQDIAFNQSHDEMIRLVEAAIEFVGSAQQRERLTEHTKRLAATAAKAGLSAAAADHAGVVARLVSCSPLHPLTTLLLGPLFRNLAQNERSLFAFLSSSESGSFQDFLRRSTLDAGGSPSLYTPDLLYDYLTVSLGTALYNNTAGRRWAVAQATLDRLRNVDATDRQVIKTVALMAVIGELGELRASADVMALALDLPLDVTTDRLGALVKKSALVYRAYSRSYHLWDGSDIDIDQRVSAAREHVDEAQSLDELITNLLPPRPLVAKRHSFAAGTLRFFDVAYTSPSKLPRVLQSTTPYGDGQVVFVLVESESQFGEITALMQTPEGTESDTTVVVPIYVPAALRSTALELKRFNWVLNNTPELTGDPVALAELRSRTYEMDQLLAREIDRAVSPSQTTMTCLHNGAIHEVPGWRGLNQLLSHVCDRVYYLTPPIRNELVNRRELSSAATAARRLLLKHMLEQAELPSLNIQGHPPQLSMYLSLLRETGLHRENNGQWLFAPPEPLSALAPVWQVWEDFLEDCRAERQSLRILWQRMKKPPFGMRDGVIPVFLVAMVLERRLEVGMYESGTFLPELTLPHLERFLKTPEKFEVRFCPIDGVRREVFDELRAVGFHSEEGMLVALVRELCVVLARLPAYSQKTKTVSGEAQTVRSILLAAREPDVLLFKQLPEALGLPSFMSDDHTSRQSAHEFAKKLESVIRELQLAHAKLHDHLFSLFASSLRLSHDDPAAARCELRERIALVHDMVVDLRMKSFLRHCANESQDYSTWIEAMGSFLANRPPSTWNDDDLARFETTLTLLANKLESLIEIAVERGRTLNHGGDIEAVRIGLTSTSGVEQQKVIFFGPQQRTIARNVADGVIERLREAGVDSEEGRLAVLALLAKSWLPKPDDNQ